VLCDDTFNNFDSTPACDRQISGYGIYCASIASHAKTVSIKRLLFLSKMPCSTVLPVVQRAVMKNSEGQHL